MVKSKLLFIFLFSQLHHNNAFLTFTLFSERPWTLKVDFTDKDAGQDTSQQTKRLSMAHTGNALVNKTVETFTFIKYICDPGSQAAFRKIF